MKAKVILIVVLCAVALCPKPAQAYLITIGLTAEVYEVEDYGSGDGWLDGKINPGDIITGYYTYESTTSDSSSSTTSGQYRHYSSPCGIFLTVSGFDFETDPTNTDVLVEISDNCPNHGNNPYDHYMVYSSNNLPLSNGTVFADITLRFSDSSGQALSSTALPLTAPDLDDWSLYTSLSMAGAFLVSSNVTSMVLIPEPASFLLLAFGAVFIRKGRYTNGGN